MFELPELPELLDVPDLAELPEPLEVSESPDVASFELPPDEELFELSPDPDEEPFELSLEAVLLESVEGEAVLSDLLPALEPVLELPESAAVVLESCLRLR